MRILYFAWVRERIGSGQEDVSLPDGVSKVSELLDWLMGRGEGYRDALSDRSKLRIAVNQDYVNLADGGDAAVSDADEIAIFPPVTGG